MHWVELHVQRMHHPGPRRGNTRVWTKWTTKAQLVKTNAPAREDKTQRGKSSSSWSYLPIHPLGLLQMVQKGSLHIEQKASSPARDLGPSFDKEAVGNLQQNHTVHRIRHLVPPVVPKGTFGCERFQLRSRARGIVLLPSRHLLQGNPGRETFMLG